MAAGQIPSGSFVYTKLISGSIRVWFDGVQRYSSSSVSMPATTLSNIQIGFEHTRQKGDCYIDDVVIKRS